MDAAPPSLRAPNPTDRLAPTPNHLLGTAALRTAGAAADTGAAVRLCSADPDFRDLLTFLFRYHGFTVTTDAPSGAPAPGSSPPALLVLDLTEATAAALLPDGLSPGPTLVLTRPERATQARQQLPAAAGWLTVPFQPLVLVALARQLLLDQTRLNVPPRSPSRSKRMRSASAR